MAHDIFDFNDGWDQEEQQQIGIVDLERDAEKQRQGLLAQQWRDGELFVTTDYVEVYENPTDPSPIVEEFEPDTVILLSDLKDSTNYGGFRDVLLPIRGWVWTSIDEYDKAFHDASMMLKNFQTRETSTSVMRLAKYAKRKLRKKKGKIKVKSTESKSEDTNNMMEDSREPPDHNRQKTNHLYVNAKQKQARQNTSQNGGDSFPNRQNTASESREFSESRELSSKFRRMSHQVTYNPASIKKIERPLSLEELDKLKDEEGLVDIDHLYADSTGQILGLDTIDTKEDNNKLTDIKEEDQESLGSKIINSTYVRKLVHFVRSHPALLTLIYIVFTGSVEGIIFFDIITDVIVTGGLAASGYQTFFVLSAVLIITPYFIAWSSLWGLIEKKREQVGKDKNSKHIIFKNLRRYRIFVTIFSFAPVGVIMLMLFDLWIVFEFILIRPLYFLCRFKLFRSDTFEELGYRKLRRVSEVCSETFFQAIVQLLILLILRKQKNNNNEDGDGSGITVFDVVLSLLASFFVIFLWFGIILRVEASANGVSIIEYLPIVLQGSFKFVPFLPAIEKGTKNGKKVNWVLFKFDLNALSALGRSLGSPDCDLQLVKCSTKTVKRLPRFGCKFLGRLMNTALSEPIQVIVSRLDTDMEELFQLFDTENTKYFNFINFCRATLALRAKDNETLLYAEISEIFYELAGSKNYEPDPDNVNEAKQQKVWLLDLMLKFRTSKQYVSILDIAKPEDYCVKSNDVNLLTFVRSMGFQSVNHDQNVISSVCKNNLQIVHALTEDEGIPIVIEITEGKELLASYMSFHRPNTDDRPNPTDDHGNIDNNMLRVQQYHKLNRLRRNGNTGNQSDPMAAFDAIFSDVSIYVSVAMCEIEKSTMTTKETINQFWNEKLLFIIPYSVIDEIRNDATHTLMRDTEHREHMPGQTTMGTAPSEIYGITGGTTLISRYVHTTSQRAALPPIQLPYNQNSESIQSTDRHPKKTKKKRTVQFENENENDLDKKVVSIEEDTDEENNSEDGAEHIKYGTVHIQGGISLEDILIDESEPEPEPDEKASEESHSESEERPRHSTGLTERLEHMFTPKQATLDIHMVPSESPNVSAENLLANVAHKIQTSSLLDNPSLLFNTRMIQGRESALRDSLHLNHYGRMPSIAKGALVPHFEKKIYLDFNLFDDSGVDAVREAPSIWDLQKTQSMGSVNKTRRTPLSGIPKNKRLPRKLLKDINKSKSYNQNNDDSDDYNSDSDQKGIGLSTPRSPRTPMVEEESSVDGGIDGGEGTFLGSAHISISIDDADALTKYHTTIREKEIKIGRKGQLSGNEKQSKLKFKVYCTALSAYLKHGKNYGDRLRELEIEELGIQEQ